MRLRTAILLTAMAAVGAVVVGIAGMAQQTARRNPDADWPTYNRDLAGTRYSPLTQINTENVAKLTQAWSYRLRPPVGVVVPAVDKPASGFEIFHEVTERATLPSPAGTEPAEPLRVTGPRHHVEDARSPLLVKPAHGQRFYRLADSGDGYCPGVQTNPRLAD